MSKIKLITEREFKNRVRKKAFIIMSILGPVLFSMMFILPAYINSSVSEPWTVVIVDETKIASTDNYYAGNFEFKNSSVVKFDLDHLNENYPDVKTQYFDSAKHCVIHLNQNLVLNTIKKKGEQLEIDIPFNYKDLPPPVVEATIKDQMRELMQLVRLNKAYSDTSSNFRPTDLMEIDIKLLAEDTESQNEKDKQMVEYGLSMVGSMLIYMFILLFGSAVMKGVSEEKNSKIVEVLISSVKPFQLMMGKIIGIGMSAIAQFLIWIVLSIGVITAFGSYFSEQLLEQQLNKTTSMLGEKTGSAMPSQQVIENAAEMGTDQFLNMLHLVDWGTICISFLLFFIGGYLLFASLFAAIGSALDTDTDANQFVFPLTLPLILSVFIAISVIENTDSSLAQWASFIPISSPVVMMARIPFGVPIWEVAISLVILYGTAYLLTRMAGKVYRVGILMYGQKVSYKTLWKWLRH